MYTKFYELAERPFELTPDARYLFLSSRHKEALAHLTYAVEERRGFVQLTGEIGTGKTMMLDALVLGLDARTKVARLSHTTISTDELFDLLFAEFGIESSGEGKLSKISEIQRFLDQWTAAGRNAVLVVDEAQNLSLPVLEEIRLLSNLRSGGLCSLQIVLAGQPEFRQKLDRAELRQLKQRIGIRYHLTPLSDRETAEYIEHRLKVAGANGTQVFERAAVDAIYAYAEGVPRMINIVCDRALVAGYGANRRRIGRALIDETLADIEGVPPGAYSPPVPVAREVRDEKPEPAPAPVEIEISSAPDREPVTVSPSEAETAAPPILEGKDEPQEPVSATVESADRRGPPTVMQPARVERPAARKRTGKDTGEKKVAIAVADTGRMPAWVLPTVVSVAAIVVVIFSAVQTGWWRAVSAPSGAVSPRSGAVSTPSGSEQAATPVDAGVPDEAVAPAVLVGGSPEEAQAVDRTASEGAGEEPVREPPAADRNSTTDAVVQAGVVSEPSEVSDELNGGLAGTDEASGGSPEASVETAEVTGDASAALDEEAVIPGRGTAVSGPGGPYRAIALSSRSNDAASGVVLELAAQGLLAEVVPVEIGDGDTWYRVAVAGGYPSLDEARVVASELKSLGYDRAWVHKE